MTAYLKGRGATLTVFQPALWGKPVVVLSNNDDYCIARSNEAKALGIEMGVPWHLRRERFARDGVIVRSSNYMLYCDMSARVVRVLADFTPELEVYSIDEAFLGKRSGGDLLARVNRSVMWWRDGRPPLGSADRRHRSYDRS